MRHDQPHSFSDPSPCPYGMGKTWFKGQYDVAKQLEQDGNSETTLEFIVGLGLAKNVGIELSYKTLKLKLCLKERLSQAKN